MRRFGSEVTIIERNERLVRREDKDISEALHELCKDEGIHVITGAQITKVEGKSGERVKLLGTVNGSVIFLRKRGQVKQSAWLMFN